MKILKLLLILFFAPLLAGEALDSPLVDQEIIADASNTKKIDEKELPPSKDLGKASDDVHKATESYETAFIKTIIVLVSLLVLVILTIWMLRKISHGRLRGMNSLKSVKILEKRPLSPKSILYLIEVSGKQVLIAESQLEVRTITTLDWLGNDKDL